MLIGRPYSLTELGVGLVVAFEGGGVQFHGFQPTSLTGHVAMLGQDIYVDIQHTTHPEILVCIRVHLIHRCTRGGLEQHLPCSRLRDSPCDLASGARTTG